MRFKEIFNLMTVQKFHHPKVKIIADTENTLKGFELCVRNKILSILIQLFSFSAAN